MHKTRISLLQKFAVSKAEMAAKVLEIQSEIPKNVVISCWKRIGFNIESIVELVDLPEPERLVLSSNERPTSKLVASRIQTMT